MFKAFPLLRSNMSSSSSTPSSAAATKLGLRKMTAVGLYKELGPIWPLPLPERLPHDNDKDKEKKKHTLVLDIDETLIHTYNFSSSVYEKPGSELHGMPLSNYDYIPRPYLKEFLLEARKLFEVVMWTAGTSSYCAAIMDSIERDILELPISFYSVWSLLNDTAGENKHANFYSLSRSQTLQDMSYMKYIPLLGRPEDRVFMIDDNERSFPLTPRHGVKVPPFEPSPSSLKDAEKDDALLQLIPLLQAVAKSDNAARELDYWRTDDYTKCDNFQETMDPSTFVRQRVLGMVDLSKRREDPIPPLKMNPYNYGFVEATKTASKFTMKPPRSKM